ncbi:DNA topoisomerase III [Thalassorhabdus alkalitolerans]|uniref:DNA topoisomerase 3 n=1 Tax=Thalassorhabdus alkalitolerans TaxID=2282697 RepID=A0ABW0YNW6_9BACI
MTKALVLAEKPSVGRDIARVLNCDKKGNGYFEGKDHIVTWALGHLVTLADPEAYGEKYRTWNLDDLPMLPPSLKLVVIKQSGKQFQTVKTQMNRNDVNKIIIATDAGREGELVARWIIEKSKTKKPLKRLWISSVTDKAIKNGFNSLKDGKQFEDLYASAVARSEADWYVGMNATRALTTKYNAQLSCGRVQTPTLAMIAKKEEEIRAFTPKSYYGITVLTDNQFTLSWSDLNNGETRIFHKEKAEKVIKEIQGKKALITDIQVSPKKSHAPQLYDLTELQRDANKVFGYSAKETLSIMQRLYEHYKVLTYPRTDSRHLSSDIVETLRERLKACSVKPYAKYVNILLQSPIKTNKSFVDDSRVSDHHAIIPTEEPPFVDEFTAKERNIYDLVVRRFISVFFPPHEKEITTVKAAINNENFVGKEAKVTAQGWKKVYEDVPGTTKGETISSHNVSSLKKGELLSLLKVTKTEGETKPPSPFNEGTLLSAMENPAHYMAGEDKQLLKTLGKTGGIGTVATRADIIEKLLNSFLIEKKGKDLVLTSKGRQLLELVPEELRSPALTAEWELKLEDITKGKLPKETFINEMKSYAGSVVKEIKKSDKKFKHDNMTGSKCPECGKFLLEVKGKKGKMHVCQDRDCGYKKNVAKVTNARCPNCRKKLELRGEGEGQIFVCRCGHKEKLSAFNKRKQKEKTSKASKGDVNKYLKKQQKKEEEFTNPALADALAKLNLNKDK